MFLDAFVTCFMSRYGAEPLLDGAQFGSAKGRIAEEEQVSEEAGYGLQGSHLFISFHLKKSIFTYICQQ